MNKTIWHRPKKLIVSGGGLFPIELRDEHGKAICAINQPIVDGQPSYLHGIAIADRLAHCYNIIQDIPIDKMICGNIHPDGIVCTQSYGHEGLFHVNDRIQPNHLITWKVMENNG